MGAACCDDDCAGSAAASDERYRRILWAAFGVNLVMFAVEIGASLVSGSVSLRADALDFLGDAANYALALAVFGMALRWRASAALLKGCVMGGFGLWVAGSTIWHAIFATVPKAELMSIVGAVAFCANMAVAALLYGYRSGDSQALSVWLCTRNDCLVNVAVIAAGGLVWASGSAWPDVAVAAVIAGLGLTSAMRVIGRAIVEMRESAATTA